ncbi:hypothetical protein D2Q93_02485 [Alicyclobacillaceae bacterium I2511]|nr:hypothetical protein D2Q93_02485 [Alicyclobacillaceae bacterium I2511]
MEQGTQSQGDWQSYLPDLRQLCQVKVEEFHQLGYDAVTVNEVWACVQGLVKETAPLHEWVGVILGLNAGRFMNFMTMQAYKGRLHEFDAENPT